MNLIHILKLVGATLIYLIVNVAISVLVVAVYAYLINPGQPNEFYDEFAQFIAPYSSVVAGMPLMFIWCWWLSKWWNLKSIVGIWIIYLIIDLSILFAAGMSARLAMLATVSLLTKLIAAVGGSWVRNGWPSETGS
ncbi:MAG: hypothetical protein OEM82_02575 [Acidobacteriota bacterium]|nr:hypothetical protein [Acidobacteriota bacterium]MDH3528599.1 hypothetical protein [Acidobacteriota bacterium]